MAAAMCKRSAGSTPLFSPLGGNASRHGMFGQICLVYGFFCIRRLFSISAKVVLRFLPRLLPIRIFEEIHENKYMWGQSSDPLKFVTADELGGGEIPHGRHRTLARDIKNKIPFRFWEPVIICIFFFMSHPAQPPELHRNRKPLTRVSI